MALKVGELFASLSLDAKNFESGVNNAAGSLLKIGAGVLTAKKALDAMFTGVKYNAELETLSTSFEVMSGSAEVAAETVNRLKAAGAATPYDTAGLAKVTQLMMQYGFTAQDAVDQTLMLGDIAQGNSQNLMSIATGYAQMSSAAKVSLQDVKQMINGGFNPLEEIAASTGESIESLYDRISAGTMDVLEITASIMRATSEGGKFFGSSEKQAKTFNGQVSTLKENWKALLGELAQPISLTLTNKVLPSAISFLNDLLKEAEVGGLSAVMLKVGEALGNALKSGIESGLGEAIKWIEENEAAVAKETILDPSTLRGEQRKKGKAFNLQAYFDEASQKGASESDIAQLVQDYEEAFGAPVEEFEESFRRNMAEDTEKVKKVAHDLLRKNDLTANLDEGGTIGALTMFAAAVEEFQGGRATELAPADIVSIIRKEYEAEKVKKQRELEALIGADEQIYKTVELQKPGTGLGKVLQLQRTLDGVASSPAKLGKGLLLQRYFDGELGAGQMSDAVENVQKVRHTLQLMKEFVGANDQYTEVVQIMTAREKTVEAIREYARELYAERGAEAANISGLKLTMMAGKAAKEYGWDTSEIAPGDYAQIILDEINAILSEGASGSGSSGSSFGEAFTAGLADGIRSSARVVEDAVREIVNALRVQISVPLPTIRYSPVPVSVSGGGSSGVNFGSAPYVGSASDVGSAIAAALARSGALNADVYIDGVKVGYQTAKPVQYANNQRAAQSVAARGKSEVSLW